MVENIFSSIVNLLSTLNVSQRTKSIYKIYQFHFFRVTPPPDVVVPPTDRASVPPVVIPPVDNGSGGGGTGTGTGGGGDPPIAPEDPARVVGLPENAGSAEGARAAGVAGAMLGVLAAVSSAMWALYKFKPGLIGGGGGSGANPLSISAPTATGSYHLVNTQTSSPPLNRTAGPLPVGAGAGGGSSVGFSGFGANSAYGSTSFTTTKVEVANGGMTGGSSSMSTQNTGGAAAGQANLASYFSPMGGAPLNTSGSDTMNRGIQTDMFASSGGGGSGFAGGSSSTTTKTTTMYTFDGQQTAGGYSAGQTADGSSSAGQQSAIGYGAQGSGYGAGGSGFDGAGYSQVLFCLIWFHILHFCSTFLHFVLLLFYFYMFSI